MPDEYLIIGCEAVVMIAGSKEAVRAREYRVIEQLRGGLHAAGVRSESQGNGQRGGHVYRCPDR